MWWNHNREKADNYPQFTIDDRTYSVVRCDICSKNGLLGYGITDKNGNRIDWKAKKGKYFTRNK